MIKYFRQIRQNLLMNNNSGKYLKYALGEILLVVVGILIALQINNWNEGRIIKHQEKEILEKLKNDLNADFANFTKQDSFYSQHVVHLQRAHEIIYKSKLRDEDIEIVMSFGGANIHDIIPRRTAFDEMIHSGKIYNLSNDALVENIIEYYRAIDAQIYQIRQTRNEFRAVFYGPKMTDFWYWRGDTTNRFKYAKLFFDNKNTEEYKVLKQCAGWSINIIHRFSDSIKELQEMNRKVYDIIENKTL